MHWNSAESCYTPGQTVITVARILDAGYRVLGAIALVLWSKHCTESRRLRTIPQYESGFTITVSYPASAKWGFSW